jgi:hypothetical protein
MVFLFMVVFLAMARFRRHRVEAPFTEGIATQHTKNRKIETFQQSMGLQCFDPVLRASRVKAAGAPEERQMDELIETDKSHQQVARKTKERRSDSMGWTHHEVPQWQERPSPGG